MNRTALIGVVVLAGAGYWWWMQRNSSAPAGGGLYGSEGYTGGGYIGGQGGGWNDDVLWDEGGGLSGGEGSDDLQGMSSNDTLFDSAPDYPYEENSGTSKDVDTLARTLWGEARGEVRDYGIRSLQAVANVIVNRVKTRKYKTFRGTIWETCLYPKQFSCWNANDPNRKQLLAVTPSNAIFAMCLNVAQNAATGMLPDITGGADHYHTTTSPKDWDKKMTLTAKIGHHLFYRS